MKRVIVCAGGTGGHVFPALALCEQLIEHGYQSLLLTDIRGRRFCDKTIAPYQVMPEVSSGLKSLARSVINGLRIAIALAFSWKKEPPVALVGFGGIITIIPLLVAKIMKIPAIVHEQNAVLGKANKLLSKFGCVVTSNFVIQGADTVATPVRHEIQEAAASVYEPMRKGRFVITVVGGSQGASVFGRIVPLSLEMLPVNIRKNLTVVQQADYESIDNLTKTYEALDIKCKVVNFIHDVANVLINSSLVICRAGASTINELATVGRPAILIPYPYAAENHQRRNAENVENCGAAWVIDEKILTPKMLANKIEDFIYSKDQISLAAVNMLRSRHPQANSELRKYVINQINGGKREIISD